MDLTTKDVVQGAGIALGFMVQLVAIAYWGGQLNASVENLEIRMSRYVDVAEGNERALGQLRNRVTVLENVCPAPTNEPSDFFTPTTD